MHLSNLMDLGIRKSDFYCRKLKNKVKKIVFNCSNQKKFSLRYEGYRITKEANYMGIKV